MSRRRKKFPKDGFIDYLEISNETKLITYRDYVGTVELGTKAGNCQLFPFFGDFTIVSNWLVVIKLVNERLCWTRNLFYFLHAMFVQFLLSRHFENSSAISVHMNI